MLCLLAFLFSLGDCKRLNGLSGILPLRQQNVVSPVGASIPTPTSIPPAGPLERMSLGPAVGASPPCGHPNCPVPPPALEASFLGDYSLLVNGLPGNLSLYWDNNNQVQGTLILDVTFLPLSLQPYPIVGSVTPVLRPVVLEEKTSLRSEQLQSITGTYPNWIQWYRPLTKQWFYGILERDNQRTRGIHGYVADPSGNEYRFDAVRYAQAFVQQGGSLALQPLPVPTGSWSILAGQSAGKLQLTPSGSSYTATIQLDLNPLPNCGMEGGVEALKNVKVLSEFGGYFLTFYHSSVDRTYYAVMDANANGISLHGIALQGTSQWIFSGTRDAVYLAGIYAGNLTTSSGGKPSTPGILGIWHLGAGGRQTAADFSLSHTVSGYHAQLNTEVLTSVNVIERYNSLFITFISPSSTLTYYGLFVGDYFGLHGEFIGTSSSPSSSNALPWDAA